MICWDITMHVSFTDHKFYPVEEAKCRTNVSTWTCLSALDVTCWNAWCHVLKCLMSRVEMPDVTCRNAWCHVLKFLMSRVEMPDVTCWNAWCHVLKCLMPRVEMPDATRWNAWCDVLKCLMPRVEISDVTCWNVWFHVLKCLMSCVEMPYVTGWNALCHVLKCLMPRVEMPDATCWNAWCHVLKCLMSRVEMSDVTCWNAWCHVLICLMSGVETEFIHKFDQIPYHITGWKFWNCEISQHQRKILSVFRATDCLYSIHSFIHSICTCRMWRFLAVLRSFFHSSLLYTFSCHPSPPTILPSSLTSSSHLFLGLPLSLVISKLIYNTLLGILLSSVLCTCPNQRNLFNLIVCIIVGI